MRSKAPLISPAFADRYGMLPPGSTVICALSGGADSVCLLHWLLSLAAERQLRVCAAHFDHRLRGAESERDAAFAARFCESRGVALFSGSGDAAAWAAERGLGTEEAARELRYAFFEKTAAELPGSRVATAHNADDNAETLLMRLGRGSGLRGLGGIPPVRGIYIRPLLQTERSTILRYLRENELEWVEDSTNREDAYTRNRLRHRVLPLLREEYPGFVRSVSACADRLREDEAYLSAQAAALLPPPRLRRPRVPWLCGPCGTPASGWAQAPRPSGWRPCFTWRRGRTLPRRWNCPAASWPGGNTAGSCSAPRCRKRRPCRRSPCGGTPGSRSRRRVWRSIGAKMQKKRKRTGFLTSKNQNCVV